MNLRNIACPVTREKRMTVDVYLETGKIEFSNKAKENKVQGAMSRLRLVQRVFSQAGTFPCIVHIRIS